MKLKSKKPQTLVLSFIEDRVKKTLSWKPHEVLDIDDSVYFLSKKAFTNDWIEIIDEVKINTTSENKKTIDFEDKMQKAKREAEEYVKQTLTNK